MLLPPHTRRSIVCTKKRALLWEIVLLLTITFGMSGLRSALKLIDAALDPTPLSQQSTTLNGAQSTLPWLDLALQLCSAASLIGWGLLALFLLRIHYPPQHRPQHPPQAARPRTTTAQRFRSGLKNIGYGAALAALIGIPGLGLYLFALDHDLTKQVIPSQMLAAHSIMSVLILLLWSFANAFAEEIVVVLWLSTRLSQLHLTPIAIVAICALLRGSYHLYQGFSAGGGNIIMGIIFGIFFYKTKKITPLIIAHFLIDATAFVGYAFLAQFLSFI
ncbi:CPBP family intramembrane metalloprotease [Corynebacterium sp. sy039]|nr:CPBP family intramembrane metalloprotease [Corynebacterium sp. sy039]